MNLKRNLTGLLDFTGRQNREPFWIWVLICYGVQMVIGMFGMIPFFMSIFTNMQREMARGPSAAPTPPDQFFTDMQPMMVGMAIVGAIGALVFIALLAAAVARRLHDRDLSGWWALPVFVLHLVSQFSAISMMSSAKFSLKPDPQHPFAHVGQGFGPIQLAALLAVIVLVVFLALPGTPGPNRFGEDPLGGT